MHELPLLKDIVILLFASIFTSFIFFRLKFPTIIGFILGGMVIGPYGIGMIREKELVDVMAEIGVVLLLFTIGIEFSLTKMRSVGFRGLTVAILQIVLTVLLAAGISKFFGISTVKAFFFGFVIALSSTAIVLRLYMEQGEIDSPQGQLSLGILLTQDLAIVPMVLFVQIFGGQGEPSFVEIGKTLGLATVAVAGIIVTSIYIVPILLRQVVQLRSPEVFTMAGIFICLGTAWASSHFGLSLALGAFIAGIVISESEYSHQITASVLPFRDIFNSIFFISIGMLIRLDYLFFNLMPIILLTIVFVLSKGFIITVITYLMRYPLRIGFITGWGLAQVGEFSFVLLKIAEGSDFVDDETYQLFLSSIVFSMILTPLFIRYAPRFSLRLPNLVLGKKDELAAAIEARSSSVINHVIIAGFGLMGEHLANVLQKTGISYVIVDINSENVKKAKEMGHTAYYGDISYAEVLNSVGVPSAKVMVITIPDPAGARRGIRISRELNEKLHIIVRTKMMGEIADLTELGADQVIPEEFETSIEIFSRVLKEYKVPGNVIKNQIDLVRIEGYAMLRGSSIPMESMTEISRLLAASVSETFYVEDNSPVVDKTIKDTDLRKKSGASIIAIARGDKTKTNPPPQYLIRGGDILVLLGSHAEITAALDILKGDAVDDDHPISS